MVGKLDVSRPQQGRAGLLLMSKPRSPEMVSDIMRRVRSRDTGPEVSLRKALWRKGLRYRLYAKDLPGRPDLVFRREHVAVFVDGDFWHGRQWKSRGLPSLAHQFRETPTAEYWVGKIQRNVERDAKVNAELAEVGWRVVRLWEKDVIKDIDACVTAVLNALSEVRRDRRG